MKNKNVIWLSSFPKSGNTWVRAFLTAVLNDGKLPSVNSLIGLNHANRETIDKVLEINSSEFGQTDNDEFRRLAFGQISKESSSDIFIKTHDMYREGNKGEGLFLPRESKLAVQIVRNPLDIVASYAFHSGEESIQKVCDWVCESNHSLANNFSRWNPLPQIVGSWSEHVNSWLSQTKIPVHLVKYEQLIIDPFTEFSKLLTALKIDVPSSIVKNAIQATTFNQLKDLEKQQGFNERHPNSAYFFRNGGIGSFKEELTLEQQRFVVEKNNVLMKRLGFI